MITETNDIYLNTAGFGLIPESLSDKALQLQISLAANSSMVAERWKEAELPEIRNAVAGFLGAPVEQVAFLPNFSLGINCLVQALKDKKRVLLYRDDFPSLLEPFRINDFEITWIESHDSFSIDPDEISTLLDRHEIDILAISHVQWLSGFRANLEQLGRVCKQKDVIFIVDATQSAGAVPVDLSALETDAFIFSNYKWMNAGFGTGVLYVSPDFMEHFPPVVGGHNSYQVKDGQWKYEPSARSYEPGNLNMFGLTLLHAAVRDKLERGMDQIAGHNARLSRMLLEGIEDLPLHILGPRSMENRASIVVFRDQDGLGNRLKEKHIRATLRNGNVRISMHYHNTESDILALLEVLKDIAS